MTNAREDTQLFVSLTFAIRGLLEVIDNLDDGHTFDEGFRTTDIRIRAARQALSATESRLNKNRAKKPAQRHNKLSKRNGKAWTPQPKRGSILRKSGKSDSRSTTKTRPTTLQAH